ncbi:STAS domain-containing protein [Planomonospora algeriensis]
MAQLTVTVTDHHAFCVVAVTGDLDVLSADLLQQAIDRAVARGRTDLVVDAAALSFCDSRGLWTLITGHRRVAAQGGSLRLARVQGVLAHLLRLTGLTALFPSDGELDRQVETLTAAARGRAPGTRTDARGPDLIH